MKDSSQNQQKLREEKFKVNISCASKILRECEGRKEIEGNWKGFYLIICGMLILFWVLQGTISRMTGLLGIQRFVGGHCIVGPSGQKSHSYIFQ